MSSPFTAYRAPSPSATPWADCVLHRTPPTVRGSAGGSRLATGTPTVSGPLLDSRAQAALDSGDALTMLKHVILTGAETKHYAKIGCGHAASAAAYGADAVNRLATLHMEEKEKKAARKQIMEQLRKSKGLSIQEAALEADEVLAEAARAATTAAQAADAALNAANAARTAAVEGAVQPDPMAQARAIVVATKELREEQAAKAKAAAEAQKAADKAAREVNAKSANEAKAHREAKAKAASERAKAEMRARAAAREAKAKAAKAASDKAKAEACERMAARQKPPRADARQKPLGESSSAAANRKLSTTQIMPTVTLRNAAPSKVTAQLQLLDLDALELRVPAAFAP